MSHVDLGLLVLRVTFGAMLITHGANKVFGSGGLAGTARWFEGLGLRPGWLHARLAAATEIGTAILLAVGLLFPAAGAALVGLMTVAALTDHRGKGFFVFKGGWEYVAVVAVATVALVCTGPGRYSLDHALGLHAYGIGWAAAAAAVGAGTAAGLLTVARRPARQ
jgi:putative oxidoreductase